jgi:hypothetical protein
MAVSPNAVAGVSMTTERPESVPNGVLNGLCSLADSSRGGARLADATRLLDLG